MKDKILFILNGGNIMLLFIEIIVVTILFVCLVYVRHGRRDPDIILSQDFTDEEWCRRKIQEEAYLYGGSWQTGNQEK